MPKRSVLVALLVAIVVPPFLAQATGTVIGSYTMFNRLERYHLALTVDTAEGTRRIQLRSVARQLSPEARRILLPADGHGVGADQVDLIVPGLSDLAAWLCALEPEATRARAVLSRDPFEPARVSSVEHAVTCARGRP